MNIKQGDTVQVIAGKDKGKKGKVLEAFPRDDMVVVENVHLKKKHVKDRGKNKGGIIEVQRPIHVSNVMIVDPKENKPTRVKKQKDEKKGKFVRATVKSGTTL